MNDRLRRMQIHPALVLGPKKQELLARGVRVFSFSLHSPTVMPGCTPYVRTESDLKAFLATCRSYFDWFFGELAGRSMTPLELKAHLLEHAAPPPPSEPAR